MPGNSWGAARAAERGSRPVIMDTRQTLHRVPLLLVAAFARLLHPLFSPTSFCGRLLPQRGGRRATNTWHQPQKQFGWLDFFLQQMNSSWMSKVLALADFLFARDIRMKIFAPASENFFLLSLNLPLWLLLHVSSSLFDISSSNSQYPIFRYWRKSLDKNNSRFPPSNIGRAGCLLYISLIWMQGRRSTMTVMFAQADPSQPPHMVLYMWSGGVVFLCALCLWMTTLSMGKSNPI